MHLNPPLALLPPLGRIIRVGRGVRVETLDHRRAKKEGLLGQRRFGRVCLGVGGYTASPHHEDDNNREEGEEGCAHYGDGDGDGDWKRRELGWRSVACRER